MVNQSGIIFDIQRFSLHDGPGIRSTVFFKGCSFTCPWCHNPEGIEFHRQIIFREQRCIRGCRLCIDACAKDPGDPRMILSVFDPRDCSSCGECIAVCPSMALDWAGRSVTLQDVVEEVMRDEAFYRTSGGGVTFSGGEPLFQPEFLKALARTLGKKKIHTTLETNLVVPTKLVREICLDIDLFIVDIKGCDEDILYRKKLLWIEEDLFSTLHENLDVIARSSKDLWVRIPLVKGYTDSDESARKLVEFLRVHQQAVSRVELLPYHVFGEHKRKMLGMEEVSFSPPDDDRLERIVETFSTLSVPGELLHAPSL